VLFLAISSGLCYFSGGPHLSQDDPVGRLKKNCKNARLEAASLERDASTQFIRHPKERKGMSPFFLVSP
jgi:hypothetical protein